MSENNNQPASAKAAADKEKKNIFIGMEEEVLSFWDKNKIFEKSVERDAPRGEYVFYDGPPFATGTPHYGHLVASLMKDSVPRYWTMNGYRVERRWGWDCHGLPIENIVEKELNISSKKEIEEKIGVEKFNALCRSKVMEYADVWKKTITRLGRWADMDNAYRTMDLPYMESVWWSFKQLWDKDLVYKDYRSMHICPRCETTLSQSEVTEGYKDVKDLSVIAKFELVDEPGTFVLAWTTTPWTLPGNVALAVGADIDYVKAKVLPAADNTGMVKDWSFNKEHFVILAKDLLKNPLYESKDDIEVYSFGSNSNERRLEIDKNKIFKGKDLVGRKYKPLFDNYANDEKLANRENGWKIYHADFVTTTDGTGVVHIAPAFGEDDMNLGRKESLPFVQHVGMDGMFRKEMGELAGLHVKPKDDVQATDVVIIKNLDAKKLFFSKEKYEHSYPHCWRCDTPLINYATSSWFINITKMKGDLLKNAEPINWSPAHLKDGRFGQWLEGARDWSISRQRFWASCIPIWECACGERKVMGSLEDLRKNSKNQITKLILVRHGQSENNVENIITNSPDKYHLTAKGREQIEAAADKVKEIAAGDKDNVVIFSSPVLRAHESAEMIAGKLGLDFKIDKGIKEMDFGSWESRDEDDDLDINDELRQKFNQLSAEEKWSFKRGGDGESSADVGERVYNWLEDILKKHFGKTIIIVSHGDPVIDLINKLKSRNEKESVAAWIGAEYPKNGEVKIVYIDNETKKEIDLHKDSVDKFILKCDKCSGEMKRIPDVIDCWFESGSMPYAQKHYPFENKEKFENNFPAQFIAEGVDQTRAWFYYTHVLGTGVKNIRAFNNVIVNGIVLAEDGKKMSKRLKNYPDPDLVLGSHGADALRYYLLTSPVMLAENLNFSEKGVIESLRKVNMLLWNVYKFYEMYAGAPSPLSTHATALRDKQGEGRGEVKFSDNILDQWIVARLNQLISEVSEGMNNYDLPRATRPIALFIDDLSTWYLRRSRDRFKDDNESPLLRGVPSESEAGCVISDKQAALATTKYVLIELAKVMAPFTPFIAEQLWQKVSGNNFIDPDKSVHLESWPTFAEASEGKSKKSPLLRGVDAEGGRGVSSEAGVPPFEGGVGGGSVLSDMAAVRKIVELGLAKRDEVGIKVRQPLKALRVMCYVLRDEFVGLVKDELNVKEVVCSEGQGELSVELDTAMTPELIAEGAKRELVRFINAERKNAGLSIADRIKLLYSTESQNLKNVFTVFGDDLKKDVLAAEISKGSIDGGKEFDVNGEKIILKIEKI